MVKKVQRAPPKKGSVPYKILKGMKQKQTQRETKAREFARQSGESRTLLFVRYLANCRVIGGYVAPKVKKRAAGSYDRVDYLKRSIGDRRGLRGVGEGTRGIAEIKVGKFRNGTLYVSKDEIERVRKGRSVTPAAIRDDKHKQKIARQREEDKPPAPSKPRFRKKGKGKKKGKKGKGKGKK